MFPIKHSSSIKETKYLFPHPRGEKTSFSLSKLVNVKNSQQVPNSLDFEIARLYSFTGRLNFIGINTPPVPCDQQALLEEGCNSGSTGRAWERCPQSGAPGTALGTQVCGVFAAGAKLGLAGTERSKGSRGSPEGDGP